MSKIKNVTVAGSGVLGFQIAFQTAIHGFETTVYDISDEVLEKAKAKRCSSITAGTKPHSRQKTASVISAESGA